MYHVSASTKSSKGDVCKGMYLERSAHVNLNRNLKVTMSLSPQL
jgi:hypothetical protein